MRKHGLILRISLIMITGLYSTVLPGQDIPDYLPANLVGWWPFSGDYEDHSFGGENDLTPISGIPVFIQDRWGFEESALFFDGIDDVILGNGEPDILGDERTISFWVNYSDISFSGTLISVGDEESTNWGPYYDDSFAQLGMATGIGCGGSFSGQTVDIEADHWHNLTIVTNLNTQSIYIDGDFAGDVDIVPGQSCSTLGFWVGANVTGTLEYFNGFIDDIAIWNRALDATEVSEVFNGCYEVIEQQPEFETVNLGETATFQLTPTFDSDFQWQTSIQATDWQNIPEGGQYSGVTSNVLTINNTQELNDNQWFRCDVSSIHGCNQFSDHVKLTVEGTMSATEENQLDLKIFPNPAVNSVQIKFANLSHPNVFCLTDILGNVIEFGESYQQIHSLDISRYDKGVYFIKDLTTNKTTRIIIQ